MQKKPQPELAGCTGTAVCVLTGKMPLAKGVAPNLVVSFCILPPPASRPGEKHPVENSDNRPGRYKQRAEMKESVGALTAGKPCTLK